MIHPALILFKLRLVVDSGAYERYNDGRKQWSSIILGGRTLARLIWLHCPNSPRPFDSANPPTPEEVRVPFIAENQLLIFFTHSLPIVQTGF